jgi:hypothetical protein
VVRGNESEAHAILVCVAGLGVLLTAGGLRPTAPRIQQPECGDDRDRDEQPLGVSRCPSFSRSRSSLPKKKNMAQAEAKKASA